MKNQSILQSQTLEHSKAFFQQQPNKPTKQRRKARKSDLKELARAFNAKRIR